MYTILMYNIYNTISSIYNRHMSAVSGHEWLKDQTATDETSEMQHELELLHDEFSLA